MSSKRCSQLKCHKTPWSPNRCVNESTFILSHRDTNYNFTFTFSFGVDYVQRWGRPSIAAQCATGPDSTNYTLINNRIDFETLDIVASLVSTPWPASLFVIRSLCLSGLLSLHFTRQHRTRRNSFGLLARASTRYLCRRYIVQIQTSSI